MPDEWICAECDDRPFTERRAANAHEDAYNHAVEQLSYDWADIVHDPKGNTDD